MSEISHDCDIITLNLLIAWVSENDNGITAGTFKARSGQQHVRHDAIWGQLLQAFMHLIGWCQFMPLWRLLSVYALITANVRLCTYDGWCPFMHLLRLMFVCVFITVSIRFRKIPLQTIILVLFLMYNTLQLTVIIIHLTVINWEALKLCEFINC